jgi:predicted anti-sigma-YlaC factor YlaD
MNRNNMSCQAVREQFVERIDGRLDGSQRASFDAHLAGCPDCRREWDAYARVWQVLEHDSGIEPSFGFAERTLRWLNEPEKAVRRWWWRPSIRWAALATTVATLAVTVWIGHERTLDRKHAEIYTRVQNGDYLEDYDVIANLDQLKGDNHL